MLKVRNSFEKWVFVLAITGISLAASLIITALTLPTGLTREALLPAIIAPIVIAPLAGHWVGDRLLQIHHLNVQLMDLAAHDQMTKLLNRGHFFRLIEGMGEGLQGSFLLLDIDCFKRINDAYGHPAGDAVIQNVADILKSAVESDGIVARFGGEEFVICLPGIDLSEAAKKAEMIRKAVERQTVNVEGEDLGCTISIGVNFKTARSSLSEALRLADAALYEAKSHGRNRVWTAPRQAVG